MKVGVSYEEKKARVGFSCLKYQKTLEIFVGPIILKIMPLASVEKGKEIEAIVERKRKRGATEDEVSLYS